MALLNHKEYYILMSAIITLAASTAENVMQRSGVRLSVCLSVPSAHTQRDSQGAARDAVSVHFRQTITRTKCLLGMHF